jgi:hypothetical protein
MRRKRKGEAESRKAKGAFVFILSALSKKGFGISLLASEVFRSLTGVTV